MPGRHSRGGSSRNSNNNNRNSSNNGNNNQGNHGNRNQSSAGGRTCNNCGRAGHLAAACRNTNNQQNSNKQCTNCPDTSRHSTRECRRPNSDEPFCEWHNKIGHTDESCGDRKNPKSSKSNGSSQSSDRDGDVLMEGFVYAGPRAARPILTQKYCRDCNSKSHTEFDCGAAGTERRVLPKVVCWRCHERGHTGDECLNPTAKSCNKCHKSGHDLSECKSTSKLDGIRLALQQAATATARNVWPQPAREGWTDNVMLTRSQQMRCRLDAEKLKGYIAPEIMAEARRRIEEAERMEISSRFTKQPNTATTTPSIPLPMAQQPPITTFPVTIPNNTDYQTRLHRAHLRLLEEERTTRDRSIRAKITASKTMYTLFHANTYIRSWAHEILQKRLMGRNELLQLHLAMAKTNPPTNIFRDPEAMEAIAGDKRPVCNGCGAEGHIVDRWFNVLGFGVDVLEVEDYNDWGVFVVMGCACCLVERGGFRYEEGWGGCGMEM